MSQLQRVIKLGGSLLKQPEQLTTLFTEIGRSDISTAIVHGGGATVDEWLAGLGHRSEKRQGLRLSPAAQMPIMVGALAGYANKQLMSYAIQAELKPVGLSLWEAGLECQPLDAELGQVGRCHSSTEPSLLPTIVARKTLPIISCIGFSSTGDWFNVNADDAAAALAIKHHAELIYITDVDAVLDPHQQPVATVGAADVEQWQAAGTLVDGMLVKVLTALSAAQQLQRNVRIGGCACLTRPELGTVINPFV